MNEKHGLMQKIGKVLSGRGFYMVLLLCLVLLGASGYYLYRAASSAAQAVSAQVEVEVPVTAWMQEESETDEEPLQKETTEPDETEQASAEQTEVLVEVEEESAVAETEAEAETQAETALEVPAEIETETSQVTAEAETETVTVLLWPVEGEVVAAFSSTELVYNEALGDWRTHNGIDISADLGAEVLAAADGVVAAVTDDPVTGTTIVLTHSGGLTTIYGDLDPDTLCVAEGDAVSAGETLACVGSSSAGESYADGAFLHFAVSVDGQLVDPMDRLEQTAS